VDSLRLHALYVSAGRNLLFVRPCVGCHVTSAFGIPVSCIVLRTLRITMTRVRMFLYFNLMALCHSQVTLMLSTDINIIETTYSCQFQYVFGNQLVCNSCQSFKFYRQYLRNRSNLDIGFLDKSAYFNLRNNLTKSGTFPHGTPCIYTYPSQYWRRSDKIKKNNWDRSECRVARKISACHFRHPCHKSVSPAAVHGCSNCSTATSFTVTQL
jgi:hypothetical protein